MSPRERELERRVNELYLSTPAADTAYRSDPYTHADVKRLRQLIVATERAMRAEGIDEPQRDRVLHRLLFGAPEESYQAPDIEAARERMQRRADDLKQAVQDAIPMRRRFPFGLDIKPALLDSPLLRRRT